MGKWTVRRTRRPFALEFRDDDSIQRHSGMTVISRASLFIKKMSLQ